MTDYAHGKMDIKSQERTFRGFVKLTLWTCGLCAVVLAGMAFFLT